MKNLLAVMSGLVLLAAVSANATLIETESNNNFGSADQINVAADEIDMGTMTLGSATDVDYFWINLNVGDTITVTTTPLANKAHTLPDTLIGFFDATGTKLDFDDNSGTGSGSMIYDTVDASGKYYFAVTGAADTNFNGTTHNQIGKYQLAVSVVPVPEPATLGLMAFSTLCLICRKK
jgi:hypothetical protein